jgi:hypothetical protein
LKRDKYAPEQVQDYYPTPGTASTVMYYTGLNPLDMKPVYVCTGYHEKQLQRALLQYNRPENADLVREALVKAGREELIGFGEECLVRPKGARGGQTKNSGAGKSPTGGTSRGKAQISGENRARSQNEGTRSKSAGSAKKPQSVGQRSDAPKPRNEKPTYKKGWAKPKKATNKKKK